MIPTRGLRQGDPLSPYLFFYGVEALLRMRIRAEDKGLIHCVKVARNAPSVYHLLFADDSFHFCNAKINEVGEMKNILKIIA